MPKQATHVRVVRQWLQSLGVLSAVSIAQEEAEMKLRAYEPILMSRFPDAAFTQDSLEYCASRAVKGFPTYGELAGWLSDHWRPRRPPLPALEPPAEEPSPRPDLTDADRARNAALVSAVVAELRSIEQPIEHFAPRARYLTAAQLDIVNPLPGGRRRAPVPPQHDRPTDDPDDPGPAAGLAGDYGPANDRGDESPYPAA